MNQNEKIGMLPTYFLTIHTKTARMSAVISQFNWVKNAKVKDIQFPQGIRTKKQYLEVLTEEINRIRRTPTFWIQEIKGKRYYVVNEIEIEEGKKHFVLFSSGNYIDPQPPTYYSCDKIGKTFTALQKISY